MCGLDVHEAIVNNIYENTYDYAHGTFKLPRYMEELLKQEKYGIKTKEGLYRREDNKVYDIVTKKYRNIKEYSISFIDKVIDRFKVGDYKDGIRIILEDNSKEANICKEFLINYILYSIKISKVIANKTTDCDIAMAEGFNWIPPYALLEVIGKEKFKEVASKLNEDVKDIDELLKNDIKSEYRYEKFLKAKR